MRNPLQRLLVRVLEVIVGEPPKYTPSHFRMTLAEWDLETATAEIARLRAILEEEERVARLRAQLQARVIRRPGKANEQARP